jgi:hypothetical protein
MDKLKECPFCGGEASRRMDAGMKLLFIDFDIIDDLFVGKNKNKSKSIYRNWNNIWHLYTI